MQQIQEKTQINWAVRLFTTFLHFAAKSGSLTPSEAHVIRQECTTEDAEALNGAIEKANAHLKVPFPSFAFAGGVHKGSAVLDQLGMVERTLTEAAEAKVLDWEKESASFADVVQVFSQVERRKMAPEEGMAKLLGELRRLNESLSKEDAFPLPDLSAYE